MSYKTNKINHFIEISLNSADLVENFEPINSFTDGLGLGIRNYPEYVRQGVKEVIDLKQENTDLKDQLEFALDELKGYREIIDPDDLDYLTDENKKDIKEFAEKLLEEVQE